MAKGLNGLLSSFFTPWQRTSAAIRAAHLHISTFSLNNYYIIGLTAPTSEILEFIAQKFLMSESTLEKKGGGYKVFSFCKLQSSTN